jgi:phosphotransferase system enzyme I (PtsP)
MLQTISRIIQEAHTANDFGESLQVAARAIRKNLTADACSVFLLNQSQNEYVLMATEGLNPEEIRRFRRETKQGLVGLIGQKEKSIKIVNALTHPHFLYCPELKEEPYTAFLGVPIIHHRKLLGVLTIQQKEPRDFDETEEAFLVTISAQLAEIIAHADAMGVLVNQLNPGPENTSILQGIPGSAGIAIGTVVPVYPSTDLDAVLDQTTDNIEEEILLFEKALSAARKEIRQLSALLEKKLPAEEHALFSAYTRILGKDNLGIAVKQEIQKGHWAQGALRHVIQQHIYQLENVEDDYLRELAMDFRDLGQRVLAHLQTAQNTRPQYPPNTILVGEALTASILAEVPQELLVGIISLSGSANSHVAILARALGIPAVMGAEGISLPEIEGCKVIVDGYHGEIHVSPSAELEKEFSQVVEQQQQLDAGLAQLRQLPAKTLDGHLITLAVNIGLTTDADRALKAGAESIGLYRTEVPFMTHDRFPGETEQQVIYQQLLEAFAPHPVTMRTLDIGGDKALPYFPIEEENPFLGWRGIRITLDHPEVFLMQVRAMLRASHKLNNLRIMLPMISDVGEVDEAIHLIKRAHNDILEEDLEITMPLIGVMIEVPAAVYQARALAERVDFLSVGSNDLTQYLLAVDRNNPRVASLYNALHPAVLRALTNIISDAHHVGKPVSICGEMTSDPAAVIALLGMGFDSLSMNSTSLPRIKWVIRNFTLQRAQEILAEILSMDNPKTIRCHLEKALEDAGLSELTQLGL